MFSAFRERDNVITSYLEPVVDTARIWLFFNLRFVTEDKTSTPPDCSLYLCLG